MYFFTCWGEGGTIKKQLVPTIEKTRTYFMYGPIFVATATQRGEGMTPYVHITIIPWARVRGVRCKT